MVQKSYDKIVSKEAPEFAQLIIQGPYSNSLGFSFR